MTLAVPADKLEAFVTLAKEMDVEATDLGNFTDSGYFHCLFEGKTVSYLSMEFLHEGVPQMVIPAKWQPKSLSEPEVETPKNLNDELQKLLSRLNICSKESVVRRYDHEVQAGTVIKPLVGVANDGPSDAAVFRPILDSFTGVVVSHGICPSYSDIDTYHMMACAIDEGLRNYVAVGGDIDHVAGLDNFCWCDPVQSEKTPDGEYKAAQLVRANKALYDYCVAFGVPLISGKDSMKNDYQIGDTKISIPPTVLFSVIGKIADARKSVSMDVKRPDDLVYLLGDTHNELGGSEYYAELGELGSNVPKVDAESALHRYRTLNKAQEQQLVASCHDLSDGGLAVALAEKAFAGGYGIKVSLAKVAADVGMREDQILFSESQSRLLVTVHRENQTTFEALFKGQSCQRIGTVCTQPELLVTGENNKVLISSPIDLLKEAWQAPLREM
nr:AIR synthase-related protein [Malonomonas rubra]